MPSNPIETPKEAYWRLVKAKALELKSDGCTGVTAAFLRCCHQHDIHYRTQTYWKVHIVTWGSNGQLPIYELITGDRITSRQADHIFRECMKVYGPEGNWFEKNLNS